MENQFTAPTDINEENRATEAVQTPTHQFTPQFSETGGHAQSGYEQQPIQQSAVPQPRMIQIPEYSHEQKVMQEKIKQDRFGLLKLRQQLRSHVLITLMIASVICMICLAATVQISAFRSVGGADVRRFENAELLMLSVFYGVLFIVGGVALIFMSQTIANVNKIRVDSIASFDRGLKRAVLLLALTTAGFFFMSAFWLTTSFSSYWIFFLFQSGLAIALFIFLFKVLQSAATIGEIEQREQLVRNDKPMREIVYYRPSSYRQAWQYPDGRVEEVTQPYQHGTQ